MVEYTIEDVLHQAFEEDFLARLRKPIQLHRESICEVKGSETTARVINFQEMSVPTLAEGVSRSNKNAFILQSKKCHQLAVFWHRRLLKPSNNPPDYRAQSTQSDRNYKCFFPICE